MYKINSSFNIYTYTSIALCSATLLSTILLSSSIVSADTDSTDTVSLTVPIACTMTGEGTSHTATLDPGTYSGATGNEYENGIGKTTLTAICNDDNGFSIYAIGYTGNQYEGENHTKLIGQSTSSTIATKAYASGDTTSNWSMKLTKVTDATVSYNPQNFTISTGYDNWHAVPDTFAKVAEYHANTGSSTTDTTLGVKLETTYAAYISSSQPADTYAGQVKYTLVHPYDHAEPDEFTSETLQSVADWGSKVAPGQTVTVTDARDGQEYTVARLADGKLWMTKNLRLDIGRANITAENTNNPTQAFLTAVSNASSSNEWCTDNNSTCTDQIKYNTSNINNPTTDSEGHKYDEYGVYYNWYTATAGNGTYNTASNTNVSGDICPSGWHLPSGTYTGVGSPNVWTGDYWNLVAAQDGGIASDNSNYSTITGATGSERLRSSPNDFLYSGHLENNSIKYQGEAGHYWTGTRQYDSQSYTLRLASDSVAPGITYLPISSGAPIRCIANPISVPLTINYGEHSQKIYIDGESVEDGATVRLYDGSIHSVAATFESGYTLDHFTSSIEAINGQNSNTVFTMVYEPSSLTVTAKPGLILQQVDTWGDSVEINETVHAFDVRDNSEYTVSRLADGKLWMTRNLRLNLESSIITADNTNNPTAAFLEEANAMPAASNILWCENTSYDCANHIQYSTISIGDNQKDSNNHSFDDYGVYYNWYTATGGNGTASTPNNSTVAGDICPAGWRLPILSYTSGDFVNLAEAIKEDGRYSDGANAQRFINPPIDMPLAGSIKNNGNKITMTKRTTGGAYWSATKNDINSHAYYWMLSSESMHEKNYGDGQINYGNSVRCLTD